MYGETLDFHARSALATQLTVHRRVLTANLLQFFFSDWAFYVTIADADIGRLKSLHT